MCLRLFSGAYLLAEKDKNLDNALLWSQNLSEGFYGCKGDINELGKLFSDSVVTVSDKETDGTIVLFFDENWAQINSSIEDEAAFEALMVIEKEKAKDVYSDVEKYKIPLKGNAITGKIAIIDLSTTSYIFSDIPGNENLIIYQNNVDVYLDN